MKLAIKFASDFVGDEQGQDTVEYTLLLAFFCLIGAAVFIGMSRSTNTIWSGVNSRMASANQAK